MIYHFLPKGVYANSFISFMQRNQEEIIGTHKYVFYSQKKKKASSTQDVLYIYHLYQFFFLWIKIIRREQIILHSYCHPWLYLLCFICKRKLSHVSWVIWGGDLHFYEEKKTVKFKLYEFLRKKTICKFGHIIGLKGDYALAVKYYKTKAALITNVHYPLNLPSDKTTIQQCTNSTNVLIGNSADPSNNHIKTLELLEPYKTNNINVYTILSYGGNQTYIEAVNNVGYSLFGQKYHPITYYMTNEEYNQFLSQMDVMVNNHNRQQALGNIFALLSIGKKVYINDSISSNLTLSELGLTFYCTGDITQLNFEQFTQMKLEVSQTNKDIIRNIYNDNALLEAWNTIYSSILNS